MTIEKVVNKYKKSEKQPNEVWANIEMDELRRKECLCLNCERTKNVVEIPYSPCPVAKQIYELCVKNDMAIAITRCGVTNDLGTLMYVPREK